MSRGKADAGRRAEMNCAEREDRNLCEQGMISAIPPPRSHSQPSPSHAPTQTHPSSRPPSCGSQQRPRSQPAVQQIRVRTGERTQPLATPVRASEQNQVSQLRGQPTGRARTNDKPAAAVDVQPAAPSALAPRTRPGRVPERPQDRQDDEKEGVTRERGSAVPERVGPRKSVGLEGGCRGRGDAGSAQIVTLQPG